MPLASTLLLALGFRKGNECYKGLELPPRSFPRPQLAKEFFLRSTRLSSNGGEMIPLASRTIQLPDSWIGTEL